MTAQDFRCPPEHTHAAKTTCYGAHKCRCFPCRRANADRTAQARLNPEPLVMAPEPVAAHVAYLKSFGYSYAQIARAAGVNEGTPLRVTRNRLRFVQAHVGRAILAVRPNIADLELHTIIPTRGVRRRLEALATRGWSIAAIAEHAGIGRSHLSHLAWKDGVTVRNHLIVANAYEALWNANPPARDRWELRTILRTQNRAQRLGWASPLAWDDIDYDAEPARTDSVGDEMDTIAIELAVSEGARVQLTTSERREAVRQLHALQRNDREIAEMLGVAEKTIARDRQALGNLPAVAGVGGRPLAARSAA